MGSAGPGSRLLELIEAEQAAAASPAARALATAIRSRFGVTTLGILFYGSCLRRGTSEGVHDFYVVVESYKSAYESRRLRLLNSLLPPNVFYIETADDEGQTQRAKYAVISLADFESNVAPSCFHPDIWARFTQPSLLVYTRDLEARTRMIHAVAQAHLTAVKRLCVFMPASERSQRYSLAAFWQEAFRRTYTSEMRGEKPETIRAIYRSNPGRYDDVGRAALGDLEASGWIERVSERGDSVEVQLTRRRRILGQWRWHLTRPLAKALAFTRLIKSATTFGDWVPYILWKVERHSGVHIELSDRQRRHPFLFGWPILLRLLTQRELR